MQGSKKEVFVAMFGASGTSEAVPVGVISFVHNEAEPKKAVSASSFTYTQEYGGPPIDPVNLNYRKEKKRFFQLPTELMGSGLFRVFHDSMPGTWGRRLLNKEHPDTAGMCDAELLAFLAEKGHGSGAMLFFAQNPDDEHPLTNLPAVDEFRVKSVRELAHLATEFTNKELSSALIHGGAKPKTTFFDARGEVGPARTHYLVKFNVTTDTYNSARLEHAALEIAAVAGIKTSGSIVVRIRNKGVFITDIYLTPRYDRFTGVNGDDVRRHRISALALCPARVRNQADGDYADIAAAIRAVSAKPEEDLAELFRRMLFNIGINNTDDHLKNHEMVLHPDQGWRLSPAYDLVPNSYPYDHATTIANLKNGSLKDDFVIRVAEKMGMVRIQAMKIRDEVVGGLSKWQEIAAKTGCGDKEKEYLLAAFKQSGVRAEANLGFGRNLADPMDRVRVSTPVTYTAPTRSTPSTAKPR